MCKFKYSYNECFELKNTVFSVSSTINDSISDNDSNEFTVTYKLEGLMSRFIENLQNVATFFPSLLKDLEVV